MISTGQPPGTTVFPRQGFSSGRRPAGFIVPVQAPGEFLPVAAGGKLAPFGHVFRLQKPLTMSLSQSAEGEEKEEAEEQCIMHNA